mgnify:CR=1 FL=1
MANRGQADVQIQTTTSSSTGAWRDMSQYMDTFNGIETEAILQQSDGFGDSWVEFLFTGIRKAGKLEFEGFYEDTGTSGPNALWGQSTDVGAERAWKINVGTTGTTASGILKVDGIIEKYARMPKRGELTRFKLTVQPTGPVTYGTAT